jgi:hypothetical protein
MLSAASVKESRTVEADEKPLPFDEFVSNAPTIFDTIEEHGALYSSNGMADFSLCDPKSSGMRRSRPDSARTTVYSS